MKIAASSDMRVFVREMSRVFTTDEDKVRAVYYWITENIDYDCAGYHNNLLISTEIDDILKSHKAVCSGYSALMQYGCDVMNIECKTIEGVARNYATGFVMRPDSLKTNHAWNSVKIKGEWKLIDATWASGSTDKGTTQFKRKRDDNYFMMRPDWFICQHLPDSSSWQLLKDSVVTQNAFCLQPLVMRGFFENQIESVQPSSLQLIKKIGDTITFKFSAASSLNEITIYSEEKPAIILTANLIKKDSCYYFNYIVTQPGKYDLTVWLNDSLSAAIMYSLEVSGNKQLFQKIR
ncbi:MAG TPA: transglutaminase domain-containing protein [Chitinophagaceae bacterium]|nr:transglutaminase domain-containing protein [Chitinophagaceae bacterium]